MPKTLFILNDPPYASVLARIDPLVLARRDPV